MGEKGWDEACRVAEIGVIEDQQKGVFETVAEIGVDGPVGSAVIDEIL